MTSPTALMQNKTGVSDRQIPRIAVLIPCYNEGVAISGVVGDFRRTLPFASIYVYDNNSTDDTAALAGRAGAIVRRETLQGKGHVIRRMFSDIEADLYVLVDGDGTYDAQSAPWMVRTLLEGQLDMVSAVRDGNQALAVRRGHRLGNRVLGQLVSTLFGNRISDFMSGYRVFSRRFVKSFPASASGFETETEFSIHALELKLPIAEVKTVYRPRVEGSSSKLRTYSDGARILITIVRIMKEERPLKFFSLLGTVLMFFGVGLSLPIFGEFERSGLVPRLPTAVLCTGIVLVSFLAFACGLILDSVALGHKDAKRLAYLALPSPPPFESWPIDTSFCEIAPFRREEDCATDPLAL